MLTTLLAGLPWALVSLIGWPLPSRLPTWGELEATVLNPMSPQFLLNFLATLCWLLWLFFVVDVLLCCVDIARGRARPQLRVPGPLRGPAAALVGTVALTLLGGRTASGTALPPTSMPQQLVPVAVSAPLTPGSEAQAPPGMAQISEEVRPPSDGVHDSLWRVAVRIYGPDGGNRWPELFQLNRGIEQPDGRHLSNPNLVRPGWKIIAFVTAPREEALSKEREPSASSEQPAPPRAAEPPPRPERSGEQIRDHTGPGLDLVTGAFVSVGLAVAVTAAVMSARMWRRRRYRIGSGDRTDLRHPVAPVVRALRADDQRVDNRHEAELVDLVPRTPSVICDPELNDRQTPVLVRAGVRGHRELAVSLASTQGLGLAGAGALAVARALLLHLLAEPRVDAQGVRVIIPVGDLHHVFDGIHAHSRPSSLLVVDSLDAALDEMESVLLTRTRQALDRDVHRGALVLLASPAPHADHRLQSVLDNGSVFGMAGILLGQWRPGVTALIRDDGTVRAASPGPGEALIGSHLFSLPAADANDLLTVLREAEGPIDELVPAVAPKRVETTATPEHEGEHPDGGSEVQDTFETHGEQCSAEPSRPHLTVSVMGRVRMVIHSDDGDQEIGGVLTPKQREMLVYLALHPDGTRRDVLNEAIWPNSRPPRPYNSFHNTMSMLRRVVAEATGGAITDFVLNENGRYRLNSALVEVDFWNLRHALNDARTSDAGAPGRSTAAVELYRGDFAEDVTAAWAEPIRESVRRDVLDALGNLIRAHNDSDPETALALLERTRKLDPYNEDVYRSLIRVQARLSRYDAIPRAVALLTTTLAEIGEQPSSDILDLADSLQRRDSTRLASPDNVAAT